VLRANEEVEMVESKDAVESRRGFFKLAAGAVSAVAGAALLKDAGAGGRAEAVAPTGAIPAGSDEVLRMTADLRRALEKKPAERRWGMVIDTRRCIGCSACTVACVAENNLPAGVMYRTVPEVEDGTYPDVRRIFMPTNCAQCENPPCVPAANKVIPGSMKRRSDGIVEIDYKKMRGKKVFEAAKKACPYSALSLDEGKAHTAGTPALQPYENRAAVEYGKAWTRKETAGSVRKCHFCTQRLDAGMLPACVTTCTGVAMHFGDLNDPKGRVAELAATGMARRLEPGKGTGPRVWYLDDFPEDAAAHPAVKTRTVVSCGSCHEFDQPEKK